MGPVSGNRETQEGVFVPIGDEEIKDEADSFDEKFTQKQLIIKTATLLGMDVVLVGAGVTVREDLPLRHLTREIQDWVIVTELNQEGDIIDEVPEIGDLL